MTTKSPTSTCGAYWGLCLPRRSCAVWLASRPSTTSAASMTCQARATSPGLGVYVRTALVSSVVMWAAGRIASPSTGDGAKRAAPAGSRASRSRYQPLSTAIPGVGQAEGLAAGCGRPLGVGSVVGRAMSHGVERVDLAVAVPGVVPRAALALLDGPAVLAGE